MTEKNANTVYELSAMANDGSLFTFLEKLPSMKDFGLNWNDDNDVKKYQFIFSIFSLRTVNGSTYFVGFAEAMIEFGVVDANEIKTILRNYAVTRG